MNKLFRPVFHTHFIGKVGSGKINYALPENDNSVFLIQNFVYLTVFNPDIYIQIQQFIISIIHVKITSN